MTSKCLLLAMLCFPVFGSTITYATASASHGTSPDCSQTDTSQAVLGADASCSVSGPGAEGAGAFATASAGFLFLSVYVQAEGGAMGGPEISSASAGASYDYLMTIDGGVGAGTLTVDYSERGKPLTAFSQGDVHLYDSVVTSSFTYGVPFEVSASVSIGPLSSYSGDNGTAALTNFGMVSMVDQNGNPVTDFTYSDPSVPEPATWAFMLIGLAGIAIGRRPGQAGTD